MKKKRKRSAFRNHFRYFDKDAISIVAQTELDSIFSAKKKTNKQKDEAQRPTRTASGCDARSVASTSATGASPTSANAAASAPPRRPSSATSTSRPSSRRPVAVKV